jgi:hypothetical protein
MRFTCGVLAVACDLGVACVLLRISAATCICVFATYLVLLASLLLALRWPLLRGALAAKIVE